MATTTINQNLNLQPITTQESTHHRVVIEEIQGLIRVYKDGHVERPHVMPSVDSSLAPDLGVTCNDMIIDKHTNIWARCYVPKTSQLKKLPLILYFHGGGFCVGSANWSCYHEFLAKLASQIDCIIVSVNYRLAPENPLPAAYDDGVKAFVWVKQQNLNFSSVFLAGDSAGANIAYNVVLRIKNPLDVIKGIVLIQPFFGGEIRTDSEKYVAPPPRAALTVAAADTYWRLALPRGVNRDHPWCNPTVERMGEMMMMMRCLPMLVCIAEMDVLKDRNIELCGKLESVGGKVERLICKGVGHAFQILNKSNLAQSRVCELICGIKNFIGR